MGDIQPDNQIRDPMDHTTDYPTDHPTDHPSDHHTIHGADKPADWVDEIVARRWQEGVLTLLDVTEPIAPLLAQFFLIGAPLAQRWGQGWQIGFWQGMRDALESRDAREDLRQRLQDIP